MNGPNTKIQAPKKSQCPNSNAWFHAKVVVEKRQVKGFVNGATEPSLVVNELSHRPGGSVGLWCNGYGVIANLKIMPNK